MFLLFSFIWFGLISWVLFFNFNGTYLISGINNKIPLKNSPFKRSLEEFEKIDKVNILFLGSSHCNRGINPETFNTSKSKNFNLGNHSQTPANSYVLAEYFLNKFDTLVLEVYPVVFSIEATESYYDLMATQCSYTLASKMAYIDNQLTSYSLLMQKFFLDRVLQKDTLKNFYFKSGFTTVRDSAVNRKVFYNKINLDTVLMEKQFDYLQRLSDLCSANNKVMALVYAPIPSKLALVGEEFFNVRMQDFLNRNKELNYFNYVRKHSLNDSTHFYDDDHLNATGVKIFNAEFLKDLRKRN